MKKVSFIIGILLTVMVSCKEEKKEATNQTSGKTDMQSATAMADATFSSDRIGSVFSEYQQLRTALVASDAENAQKAAGRLANALGEDQAQAKSQSRSIASTEVLEVQRTHFSELTASLDPLFREEITEGEIYRQFCPMAFEGKGGFWISDKEEIRNPYYGDQMLTCGKVAEVIKR